MFEQSLGEMTATIFVDDKGAETCRHNGIALDRGPLSLTYETAVALVERMQRAFLSVPKYQQARFRATMNSIRNAFGPEFWEQHPER
jgi:hypothetical protein